MIHFDKHILSIFVELGGKKHQIYVDNIEPTWTHVFCMFRVFTFPHIFEGFNPFHVFRWFLFGPPMGWGGWSLSQYARR